MKTGRAAQSATLLSDGHVLIAGGVTSGEVTVASAELFDPASGTFSPTGSMAIARENQSATRLADGRVLIAGGMNTAEAAFASAELYRP
jgi:hypothetical protein